MGHSEYGTLGMWNAEHMGCLGHEALRMWDAQDDSPAMGSWQQLRALCSFAGPSDHHESKQLPALTAS